MTETRNGYMEKGERFFQQDEHGACAICGKPIKPNERHHDKNGKKTHIACEIKHKKGNKFGGKIENANDT